VKAFYYFLLPLRILAWYFLLFNYLGNLLAILIGILTYSCKIKAKSTPILKICRNYNSFYNNADLIFKNIILDFIKERIKIAIRSIIVLPLSLVLNQTEDITKFIISPSH
jgi:hypothetical protein